MVDLEKMQRDVANCLTLLQEIRENRNGETLTVQEEEKPIGINEAADFLGVRRQTVYQSISKLKHRKRFGKLYFFKSELLEYLRGGQSA